MMRLRVTTLLVLASLAASTACGPAVEYGDDWMDSPSTHDPNLDDPDALISGRDAPTDEEKLAPIIVTAHGFGASGFEWKEFRDYAEDQGVPTSLVVLGGHGRSTDEWVATSWEDWQAPIIDELKALTDLGYENIHIAASSTGCPLYMEALLNGKLDGVPEPPSINFIAPLIRPQNDLLYAAPAVGWYISNMPVEGYSDEEKKLFYVNRPASVFYELLAVVQSMEPFVDSGEIQMPEATRSFLIRQAEREGTVSPEGTEDFAAAVKLSEGEVDLKFVDSDRHMFQRSAGLDPESFGDAARALQLATFDEILDRVLAE